MQQKKKIHCSEKAYFIKKIRQFELLIFGKPTFTCQRSLLWTAITLCILIPSPVFGGGGAYSYHFPPDKNLCRPETKTVIGMIRKHVIQKEETLLDVARDYGLGFNEIEDLYPRMDAWIPPVGTELTIPTQWILPEIRQEGIIINVAELRLYYFTKKNHMVKTFPIGIGRQGWHTPLGEFTIASKRKNPVWYIPKSLQEKYQAKIMPAGPDNPLGDYFMGLSDKDIGIHGTNFPWAVGRLVTHGCIRLYPEDIGPLFGILPMGTPVKIIYKPIKFGACLGKIYVEVHRDIYRKMGDFVSYGRQELKKMGLDGKVDMLKFREALNRKDGMPTDITPLGHTPCNNEVKRMTRRSQTNPRPRQEKIHRPPKDQATVGTSPEI
jgi:L,D-transpeptidase ErfK/SrfK